MTEHRAFFGDGEKLFAFPTRELIEELEQKTGHGVGALFRRFKSQDFAFMDLIQVLRIGLVGGGTHPREADRLVANYCIARPLAESFEVADGIIAALFFGNDEAQGENGQAAATGDLAAAVKDALKQVAE
ncbi:gene transfer agent family protein [Neorhizobium petrolearium]|uniref:gene transfer agent family protein n=1 Tax=Neorhizobium petrolearium TaxID=515361 RepID=UPI003F17EF65